jgi:hypothetical protein
MTKRPEEELPGDENKYDGVFIQLLCICPETRMNNSRVIQAKTTAFLDTKVMSREEDPDKKWITTWNHYLNGVRLFFRWDEHGGRCSGNILQEFCLHCWQERTYTNL